MIRHREPLLRSDLSLSLQVNVGNERVLGHFAKLPKAYPLSSIGKVIRNDEKNPS